MAWLEYDRSSGYVVCIHEVQPESVIEENSVVESNQFTHGDELSYCIYTTKDNEGNIVGFGAVQKGPLPSFITSQLDESKRKQELMQQALDELILGGVL